MTYETLNRIRNEINAEIAELHSNMGKHSKEVQTNAIMIVEGLRRALRIVEEIFLKDGEEHGTDTNVGGNLIDRQAALDAIKKLEKPAPTAQHLSAIFDCEDTIKALPSAQPEIMRCKDCRYNNDCEIQYNAQSGDEFFCGCAERKDNG